MIEAFIETAIIDIVNNGGDLSTSAIIVDHQLTGTMNIQNSVFMNCLRSLSQYTEDLKIIVYMGQMRYRDLQTNETTVVAALDTYDALESRSVYALGIWTFDIQLYVSLKAEQERIGEENLPVYIYPRDTIYYDPNGLCIKKFISMGVGFTVQFAWFE